MRHHTAFAALAGVLALSACSMSTMPVDAPLLGETASAALIGNGSNRAVSLSLAITNLAGVAVPMLWGIDCSGAGAFDIRAYRLIGPARVLAWESAKVPRVLGCPTQMIDRTLNSGDVATINQTLAVSSILGDSLSAGPYEITLAALTTPGIVGEASGGTVILTTAVLDPPPPSLDGTWTARELALRR